MQQEIKFPNSYNQCAAFCKKTDCAALGNCVFGFNRIFGGARELRLDFNRCNLQCKLCWSNNNDVSKLFSVDEVFNNFIACISANHKYTYDIVKPQKPETFKIQSLQIIGGEPLISFERFQFILEFIKRIDNLFTEDFEYYSSSLKLDSKKRFKIKLFTNGITIGNGEISLSEIDKLNQFNNIRVDLLVSIKGFHEEGFSALQGDASCGKNSFEYQVSCLEKLVNISRRSLYIQPVLGFYHSNHFNIKAPQIHAKDMFMFNETPLSIRLYSILKDYISSGHGFFVEPVHALGKTQREVNLFYFEKCSYLEISDLIEPDLKSNSKTDYRKTNLKYLF
ncbi:MAG: 4Fe-4S cluster-binding domain-containing protein [Clostridiales bacterium]|nr:4Fe-4S cluster-binding domain-containing protein [Clostridiales bacterium]